MRNATLGLLLGIVGCSSSVFGETRVFTDSQGRSIEAELVKYDEGRREVTIKRAGQKKPISVSVAIFSADDQSYIREWDLGQSLLDKRLKVDISRIKKKDTDSSYGTSASTQVYTDHHFKIEFCNGTTTTLKDLDLEYAVYYEQEHHIKHGEKVELKKGVLYKEAKLDLPARATIEYETDKIKLYTWVTYNLAPVDAEIKGIRVRLIFTSESGEKVLREFVYPDGLETAWVSESADVRRKN